MTDTVTDKMNHQREETRFTSVVHSLADIAGSDYADAVCDAAEYLSGEDSRVLQELANRPIEFLPEAFLSRSNGLLAHAGSAITAGLRDSARGTTSNAFVQHTKTAQAPLSGLGLCRVGEDGRLYFIAKSEHYHAPLGHGFPGYELLTIARRLGIPNATHNNTRGHLTRLLEEKLASAAGDSAYRVLNLETGSLAGEAAFKMTLNRFYKMQDDVPEPKYGSRVPVYLVIGDDEGGEKGNYHGTTILTQCIRGMWPEFTRRCESDQLFLVRAIRPNCVDDAERLFEQFERPPYKIAGFFHEIVLMNYGARRLSEAFLQRIYSLCEKCDVPTVADEIQSCLWAPQLFLFREYGIAPSMVLVGKGFPGGEYAASRLLFRADLDTLPQFGALITNGQQEVAALAYLITLVWAEANAGLTQAVGDYYQQRLHELASRYSRDIRSIEGSRHLAGLYFHDLERSKRFASAMNQRGVDISVQTYKGGCPPCALTKLPLISGFETIEWLIERMTASLDTLDAPGTS